VGAGRLIQITPQIRTLVAVEPIDDREGMTASHNYAGRSSPPIGSLGVCSSFAAAAAPP
jgi:hypothetical protein